MGRELIFVDMLNPINRTKIYKNWFKIIVKKITLSLHKMTMGFFKNKNSMRIKYEKFMVTSIIFNAFMVKYLKTLVFIKGILLIYKRLQVQY